jgi:hypothetical protein
VVYHDSFWYPVFAKRKMNQALQSPWGRLFHNWEKTVADENGYPSVDGEAPKLKRSGLGVLLRSFKVLGTCIWEAPEFAARKRRQAV